jgi:hypothetical protein
MVRSCFLLALSLFAVFSLASAEQNGATRLNLGACLTFCGSSVNFSKPVATWFDSTGATCMEGCKVYHNGNASCSNASGLQMQGCEVYQMIVDRQSFSSQLLTAQEVATYTGENELKKIEEECRKGCSQSYYRKNNPDKCQKGCQKGAELVDVGQDGPGHGTVGNPSIMTNKCKRECGRSTTATACREGCRYINGAVMLKIVKVRAGSKKGMLAVETEGPVLSNDHRDCRYIERRSCCTNAVRS